MRKRKAALCACAAYNLARKAQTDELFDIVGNQRDSGFARIRLPTD
jgi:hypothetical protein